jgi:adenosine deaminase
VTLSSEFATLVRVFGFDLGEIQWLTLNAMKSAFCSFDQRLRVINEQIKPGYARLTAMAAQADMLGR